METIYIDEHFQLPTDLKNGIAATVGFFDGVHRGHRFLIEQLRALSRSAGLPSAVVTFPVHPRKVLQADYQPELLNSFEEKLFQLSTTGVDYCLAINFTKELSELSAQEFIQENLCKIYNVKTLLIGYDHKFGKGRAGEFRDYRFYGKSCGMEVVQAEELQEERSHVSSTIVRHLLAKGKVRDAKEILSYNYTLEGKVVLGNQKGREMGFPTANIDLSEKNKVVPKKGIYAAWVHIGGLVYRGMAYIGNRPTLFSHGEKRIEVHILDFSGDLYGQTIRLEFVEFLRNDIRFVYVEDLRDQLFVDKEQTIQVLTLPAS